MRGFLVAALYVSVFGCATAPAPAPSVAVPSVAVPVPEVKAPAAPEVKAPPITEAPAPAVVTGVVAEPAPVMVPILPSTGAGTVAPHIALILPLSSATFGKAAEAVQQGFLAAAAQQANGLPVRVYPCNDEKLEVVAQYQQALKAGAVAVAGPLTRPGVTALAANPDLPVPTLAMNVIDAQQRADQLYFFGLPAEVEARQVSQWATRVGLLSATVVRTDSALSKRLAQAFLEDWQHAGGIVQSEIVYTGDPSPLRLIPAEPGNMVFLAADVEKARLMRPYISNMVPVYATSQVFAGNTNNLVNYDLSEVRFVDMPWVLQPDHAAVMVYPRATPALPQDMERLYALGIDAYRLLEVFYQHDTANALPLDGVTGKVRLNGHLLERESATAVIRQGQGIPLGNKQ